MSVFSGIVRPDDSKNIRIYKYWLNISCTIKRDDSDSSDLLIVNAESNLNAISFREISVDLALYSDLGLTNEIPSGAIIEVGKPVWASVRLINTVEDPLLTLQVHSCYIELAVGNASRKIIEKSCPTDPSIEIITLRNPQRMQFKFETFKFSCCKTAAIFLTCEAILCNKIEDSNSFCSEQGKCAKQHTTRKKILFAKRYSYFGFSGETVAVRKGPIYYKLPTGVTDDDLIFQNGVQYYKGEGPTSDRDNTTAKYFTIDVSLVTHGDTSSSASFSFLEFYFNIAIIHILIIHMILE